MARVRSRARGRSPALVTAQYGVELSAVMLAGAITSLGSVAIQALASTTAHTSALRVICGATSWQLCFSAATLKVRVATADMFIN